VATETPASFATSVRVGARLAGTSGSVPM
jgi:hypothetical protein